MTGPRYFDELPPQVEVRPALRTSAGSAVAAAVRVTNRSAEPRILAVTCLGVDADWLPAPTRSRTMLPGETRTVELHLVPSIGTLPAQYPLAITVQALDPASGRAMSHAALADVTLLVDAPGQIEVAIDPPETRARVRRRITVTLTNVGSAVEQVRLEANSPEAAEVTLSADVVEVAPGHSVRVPARIALTPRWFGKPSRFSYTVSARGSSAARRAEASVTSRAFLGDNGPKAFVLIAVVALWAGLALVFIPKLASTVQNRENSAANKVSAAQRSAIAKANDDAKNGKGGKSGKSGSGGSGGSGSGGSGSGGSGSGGSGGTATTTAAKTVQFSGAVGGGAPSGVTVSMRPTSLVDQATQGAKTVGLSAASFTRLGKIPQQAVLLSTPATQNRSRSTVTRTDGAWSFARVNAPGYYLLTFDKTGYQTQRYVLDSSSAAAATPLAVTLVPGEGRLSGRVLSKSGPVGGAKIVISDGTNTLTTSSNSRGSRGSWSVTGLSTPGSYLISATKDSLSTESAIVNLAAGGTATRNLTLSSVATSLTGTVTGVDSLGATAKLGGVSVTVTDGKTSRTTTTITSGNLKGGYVIPALTPGDYTITTSAEGYLPQTQSVTIVKGEKQAPADVVLTSSTASVSGTVHGVQFNADGSIQTDPVTKKPVIGTIGGAGITLTSDDNTYKITSTDDGTFQVNGVAPGTYVLGAQYAGLTSAYTSVTVVAGQRFQVPDSALTLLAQTTTDTSSISGFVSSATNPSGTIVCPDDVPAGQCKLNFTLVNSDGDTVQTTTDSTVPVADTSHQDPADTGPTAYHLTADPGLPPGLYHLTVSATEFLPATVNVRVPANSTATAPPISLYPTNTIQGTVDALGDVFTDAKGGDHDVCAWAVPQGTKFVPPTTDCTAPSAGTQCLSKGIAEVGYAVVDRTDESYRIRGLCDATYTVYIIATNPLYDSSTLIASETVSRGQTVTYSPHIPRKGQVQVTLSVLDPSTGTPSVAPDDLTGTITCVSASSTSAADGGTADLSDTSDSIITVPGVKAAPDVVCSVADGAYTDSSGGTSVRTTLTGKVGRLVVGNDNDTAANLSLNQQIGGLYGALVSKYNTGDDKSGKGDGYNAIPNAAITITGTVLDANGSPMQNTFTPSPTTDANGCFAILPPGVTSLAPAAGDTRCSTFTAGQSNVIQTTTATALVTRRLTVSFSGRVGLQSASSTTAFSSARNDIQVTAKPARTTGLRLTTSDGSNAGNGHGIVGIDIEPVPGQAAGSGDFIQESVSTADGTITWADTGIGANLASPGKYSLTATLAGYEDIKTTITCAFGDNATCTVPAGSLVFVQYGGLTGSVQAYSGPDTNAPNHPINNAVVDVTLCKAGEPAAGKPCSGLHRNAESDGRTNGSDDGSFAIPNGELPQGNYHLTVTATGYKTLDTYKTIGSGSNTTGTLNIFASPITVSIGLQSASGTLFTCKTSTPCNSVTVQRVDGNAPPLTMESTLTDKTYYVFDNAYPGTYTITVSGNGLQTTMFTQTIPDGTPSAVTYKLSISQYMNTVSGQVNSPGGGLDGIPVELGTLSSTGVFSVATGTDGKDLIQNTTSPAGQPGAFAFTTVPNGAYVIRYNTLDPDHTEYPVTATYTGLAPKTTISAYNGQATVLAPVMLAAITHNVVVSIAANSSAAAVGSSTGFTLTAKDGTKLSNPAHTTSADGKTDTWTFNAVPVGKWTLGFTLPTGHLGTPTNATVGLTCTPDVSTTPNPGATCTSATGALVVPGNPDNQDSNSAVTVPYTLDEYKITLGVKAKTLATDPKATPPMVAITLSNGATPVYTDKAVTVANATAVPAQAGSTDTVWGDNAVSATYTATTAPNPAAANWKAADVTFSAASPDTAITLQESGATVTVTVAGTVPTGYTLNSVTLTPPTGSGITAQAAPTVNGSTYVFSDVPWATGWTATASAPKDVGPGAAKTATSTFNVTGTKAATTVMFP